jgi:hypothetical protein
MGLFDAVLGTESQTQAALNPAEAFAVIILTATASDGYLSVEQANSITSMMSRMKLFKSYPHEMINRLFVMVLMIYLMQQKILYLKTCGKQPLQ